MKREINKTTLKELHGTVFKITISSHQNSARGTLNRSDLYKSFLKLYYKCKEPL